MKRKILDIDNVYETIIKKDDYYKFKKPKNVTTSFKYIVDMNLTQSENIQLGHFMQYFCCQFILNQSEYKDLRNEGSKYIARDIDHLFINHELKKIIYAEIKTNLNLDTEKSEKTVEKCNLIQNVLQDSFPEYDVIKCLVCVRYLNSSDIPNNIIKKFTKRDNFTKENVFGLNNYFNLFHIANFENEKGYKTLIKKIVNHASVIE